MQSPLVIVATSPSDAPWVEALIRRVWGAPFVVVHDVTYVPHELSGFRALSAGKPVGLITYVPGSRDCEIVTLEPISKIGHGRDGGWPG